MFFFSWELVTKCPKSLQGTSRSLRRSWHRKIVGQYVMYIYIYTYFAPFVFKQIQFYYSNLWYRTHLIISNLSPVMVFDQWVILSLGWCPQTATASACIISNTNGSTTLSSNKTKPHWQIQYSRSSFIIFFYFKPLKHMFDVVTPIMNPQNHRNFPSLCNKI